MLCKLPVGSCNHGGSGALLWVTLHRSPEASARPARSGERAEAVAMASPSAVGEPCADARAPIRIPQRSHGGAVGAGRGPARRLSV